MRFFMPGNKTEYLVMAVSLLWFLTINGCTFSISTEDTDTAEDIVIISTINLHPCSVALEINDNWYSGEEILYDSINDTYYFSPVSIAPYLNATVKSTSNGSYYWNETPITIDENDPKTIKYQDLLYLSEDYLQEDLHLNIYHHNSMIYIDNYPTLDYSWTKYRTVYHSGGGMDGITYTNSQEVLDYNYAQGCRLFEFDFCLTSDKIPICAHDWKRIYEILDLTPVKQNTGKAQSAETSASNDSDYPPLSYEEFLSNKDNSEQFTPLSYEDLVEFMISHPDVYIITDTKDTKDPAITDMFKQLVSIAKQHDESVLDRIIPQIYNTELGDIIWKIYDWKSVIYTFYQLGSNFRYDNVYQYSRKHGIKVFTTYSSRIDMMFINPIVDRGGYIYIHTFNQLDKAMDYIKSNRVYGIYTDYLPHDCLDDVPYPYE